MFCINCSKSGCWPRSKERKSWKVFCRSGKWAFQFEQHKPLDSVTHLRALKNGHITDISPETVTWVILGRIIVVSLGNLQVVNVYQRAFQWTLDWCLILWWSSANLGAEVDAAMHAQRITLSFEASLVLVAEVETVLHAWQIALSAALASAACTW